MEKGYVGGDETRESRVAFSHDVGMSLVVLFLVPAIPRDVTSRDRVMTRGTFISVG